MTLKLYQLYKRRHCWRGPPTCDCTPTEDDAVNRVREAACSENHRVINAGDGRVRHDSPRRHRRDHATDIAVMNQGWTTHTSKYLLHYTSLPAGTRMEGDIISMILFKSIFPSPAMHSVTLASSKSATKVPEFRGHIIVDLCSATDCIILCNSFSITNFFRPTAADGRTRMSRVHWRRRTRKCFEFGALKASSTTLPDLNENKQICKSLKPEKW